MEISSIDSLEGQKVACFFVAQGSSQVLLNLIPATLRADIQASLPEDDEKLTAEGNSSLFFYREFRYVFLGLGKPEKLTLEKLRKQIHAAIGLLNKHKQTSGALVVEGLPQTLDPKQVSAAIYETVILSSYQFIEYKAKKDKERFSLAQIQVLYPALDRAAGERAAVIAECTTFARNLVNEPPNVINAVTLSELAVNKGTQAGLRVEVLEKAKLESLKMGGILGVNRGSVVPPTLTILEHKPVNALNSKPIVLVGKGVTFDTGGLSLKPTAGSMDSMKCDMAGAAVVLATLLALAKTQAPFHVIGLLPATDNRPGGDAYTPNDILSMYDGTSVEVLNTDAEGRLILADAIAFARQYEPQFILDLATLTGAAVVATGSPGCPVYSTTERPILDALITAGFNVHERLIELPLWDDYAEMIKSSVADIKNIGGKEAGSITAAKFLQHFAKETPWIHIDIAGPAYLDTASDYRPKGGTGFGVRLLAEFIRLLASTR
jgi:leucyl aminopeptidase